MHIDKRVPGRRGTRRRERRCRPPRSRLANATLPEPLAPDELIALAAQVGSDVPFFVSGSETALARGRGELLEPCPLGAPRLGRRWPGRASQLAHGRGLRALPAARRSAASASPRSPPSRSRAPDAAQLAALVENDLAAPAEELCPPSAALRERLLARGALAACVSGSGSAVFGLFASEDAARRRA